MRDSRYEIVVRGRVGERLEHLLDGFEVTCIENGESRFVGWAQDQAALQGALRKISDFGLELVSVSTETATTDR